MLAGAQTSRTSWTSGPEASRSPGQLDRLIPGQQLVQFALQPLDGQLRLAVRGRGRFRPVRDPGDDLTAQLLAVTGARQVAPVVRRELRRVRVEVAEPGRRLYQTHFFRQQPL